MEFEGKLDEIGIEDKLISAIEDEFYSKNKKFIPKMKLTRNYKYVIENESSGEHFFTNIFRPMSKCVKNPWQYHLTVYYSNHVENFWGNTIKEVLLNADITYQFFKKYKIN